MTTRLHTEQVFHDEQARERRAYFAAHPEQLRVDDGWYLGHETWVRPAVALLGDVAGRRVLDYGCGHGMAAVVLARRGAWVTAFDLSAWYVEEAAARAAANGVADRLACVQASGEQLPFADGAFDRVWGSAILHHLDMPRAARELARVLRPGGVAVFCEPWGGNPLVEWARRRLPYPGKHRSPDEAPLRERDVAVLRAHFAEARLLPFQLLSMARRVWPRAPFLPLLDRCDAALFRHWPAARRLCRYVVLALRR